MTTMRDVVAEIRRKAYGSLPDQVNIIDATYAFNDDELHLGMNPNGIKPGIVLSSGLNTWFVRSINMNTKIATVIPQFEGSPGASAAIGDLVYVAPRMTDWYAFAEASDAISSLSSPKNGLYKVGSWQAYIDPTWQTYPVPSGASASMIGLLGVRAFYPGSVDSWVELDARSYNWIQDQNVVQINCAVPTDSTLEFTYRGKFTRPTGMNDDLVEDVGLSETATHIPALGALASHFRTTEGRRNQVLAQGDPRRAEEVRSGANLTTGQMFDFDFRDAVNEEVARQIARYGYRRSL